MLGLTAAELTQRLAESIERDEQDVSFIAPVTDKNEASP
jgi:hypothetical protein